MKIKTLFLTLSTLFIALSACKKHAHDHTNAPTNEVNVNIISPTAGQEIEHEDTAHIKAEITSTNQLHGYTITLKRIVDSAIVYTDDVDAHQNNFTITHDWVNNNTIHSDMLLTIDAIVDHSGNKVSKSVQFHAHNH